MSLVTVLQRHARYNRWAYAQLLSDLPAEVFSSPLPIPFRTIRAALTHALVAEILWYSRILGLADVGGFNVTRDLVPLWHGEIGDGQWDSVSCCSTVSELACLISEQSDRWDAFLHSSSDASLDDFFSYIDTRGTSYTRRVGSVVLHAFNHATHHRGQASVGVYAAGIAVPCMDLPYQGDHFDEPPSTGPCAGAASR